MKREGRQHGMVRSYLVDSPPENCHKLTPKMINDPTSPSIARISYTKASAKPTNHSKFTGDCRWPRSGPCQSLPACKPRDKTKGTHKLKSLDVGLNDRLISWRAVDKGLGLNCAGRSASGMLRQLSEDHWDGVDDEMEGDDLDCVADGDDDPSVVDEEVGRGEAEVDQGDVDFVKVGFVWEFDDDVEDWYLVGEI